MALAQRLKDLDAASTSSSSGGEDDGFDDMEGFALGDDALGDDYYGAGNNGDAAVGPQPDAGMGGGGGGEPRVGELSLAAWDAASSSSSSDSSSSSSDSSTSSYSMSSSSSSVFVSPPSKPTPRSTPTHSLPSMGPSQVCVAMVSCCGVLLTGGVIAAWMAAMSAAGVSVANGDTGSGFGGSIFLMVFMAIIGAPLLALPVGATWVAAKKIYDDDPQFAMLPMLGFSFVGCIMFLVVPITLSVLWGEIHVAEYGWPQPVSSLDDLLDQLNKEPGTVGSHLAFFATTPNALQAAPEWIKVGSDSSASPYRRCRDNDETESCSTGVVYRGWAGAFFCMVTEEDSDIINQAAWASASELEPRPVVCKIWAATGGYVSNDIGGTREVDRSEERAVETEAIQERDDRIAAVTELFERAASTTDELVIARQGLEGLNLGWGPQDGDDLPRWDLDHFENEARFVNSRTLIRGDPINQGRNYTVTFSEDPDPIIVSPWTRELYLDHINLVRTVEEAREAYESTKDVMTYILLGFFCVFWLIGLAIGLVQAIYA